MNKFFYIGIFIMLTVGFNAIAASLAGKTITMTDKTEKILNIKMGSKIITLAPNESKIFDFESMKDSEVRNQNSYSPYRPFDLSGVALGLQRSSSSNVNVDLIPGTLWAAKIANPSYTKPPQNAQRAFVPAR